MRGLAGGGGTYHDVGEEVVERPLRPEAPVGLAYELGVVWCDVVHVAGEIFQLINYRDQGTARLKWK